MDIWAGVRVSDAYDYAKCPECGKKNDIKAESCSRCGYEFPQPSLEVTGPDMVFVPGKGYYKEGTLLEPRKYRKGYLVTGLVLAASGTSALVMIEVGEALHWWDPIPDAVYDPLGGALAVTTLVGAGLLVAGLTTRTEQVYATASSERLRPYDRAAFALRSPDAGAARFKVEVTALGF